MKNSIFRKNKKGLFRASLFGALLLCIIGIGLLVSCSAETADPAADPDPVAKTPITALTYSNATISVYTGSPIAVASPTLTPIKASATYTIKPALPNGLTLDSDGTISGTPTLVQVAREYTVTATGSGDYSGTKTAKINITVQEDNRETLTGVFSYSFASNNITRDFGDVGTTTYSPTVDAANPFNAAVSTITYSIDPAIDNTGISFDTTNGALIVNSTANAQTQLYTVTASVSSSSTTHKGSVTASFTLTINPLPITNLTYSPIVAFIGSPIDVASPTLTPTGASVTYTIDPALPNGLTLDSDGKISGTPTAAQTAADYEVTATASGNYSGTQTATISITVQVDNRPTFTGAFSYGDASNNIIRDFGAEEATYNLTVDTAFNAVGLTITYSISPAVDGTAVDNTGISFNTTNGELTVNSSANAQTTTYTVTARSSTHSGPLTADFTLTINPLSITALTYSHATISVSRGSTIPVASPTLTPTGASATYTIKPDLPEGLTLSDTGKISGATTELGTTVYTVAATASGNYSGTQTADISIAVQVEDTPAILSATVVDRSKAVGTGTVGSTFEYDKYRVHHVIFSLTSDITANATIVAKAAAEKAPTADEINAATAKMVVTAGPTAVNVYLAYHIDAVLTTNDINVLLKAGTTYSIYGMNNVGTVTKLIDISTDSVPVPATLNADEFYGTPPSDMTFATKKTNPMVFYQRGEQAVKNMTVYTSHYTTITKALSICFLTTDSCTPSIVSWDNALSFSALSNDNVNGPIQITIANPVGGNYTGADTTFTITFLSSEDNEATYVYTSGTFNW